MHGLASPRLLLNYLGPLGPSISPLHCIAWRRYAESLAARSLPPSAAAAARRAAPVVAESVPGEGIPLLSRGGGSGVRPLNLPRFLGSIHSVSNSELPWCL
jgi:hypothetical protein